MVWVNPWVGLGPKVSELAWVGLGWVSATHKFVCWIGVLRWLHLWFILSNDYGANGILLLTYLLSIDTLCTTFCGSNSVTNYILLTYSRGIHVSIPAWWWVGLGFENWTNEHVWLLWSTHGWIWLGWVEFFGNCGGLTWVEFNVTVMGWSKNLHFIYRLNSLRIPKT